MTTIERSAEIEAEVGVVFHQWAAFHLAPESLEAVAIAADDPRTVDWRVRPEHGGSRWEATVTEVIPNERIGWTTLQPRANTGTVAFEPIADDTTRVTMLVEYEAEGFAESLGEMLGVFGRQVDDDLAQFARFVESRQERERGLAAPEVVSRDEGN